MTTCVVVPTLGRTDPGHIALPPRTWCYGLAIRMHPNAEYYRRRGLAAKERAAQSADLSVRATLKDIARHWLMLAERVEWLETQFNSHQAEKNR